MSKSLGATLSTIETIERKIGGRYALFVPYEVLDPDYSFNEDTLCSILFISNDENQRIVTNLCELADLALVQSVIRNAKSQKQGISQSELVYCLEFYLKYDSFHDFEM
jgi:hypothetical protein